MAEPGQVVGIEDNDIGNEELAKVTAFLNRHLGKSFKYRKGDRGECWSMIYGALEAAGAALPCERGPKAGCDPDAPATYEWGRTVTSVDLRPGDIIQIEGRTEWEHGRPGPRGDHLFPHAHHSMLVLEREGETVKVAQQWPGKPIHVETYNLTGARTRGKILYYRPQKRRK